MTAGGAGAGGGLTAHVVATSKLKDHVGWGRIVVGTDRVIESEFYPVEVVWTSGCECNL